MAMCDRVMLDGETLALDDRQRAHLIDRYRGLAGSGERGLGLAIRETDEPEVPGRGFTLVAIVGLTDPPRPEVPEAIARCRSAGIRVVMLTGDYGLTAETIGRQIGVITNRGIIVHGEELAKMDEAALARVLAEPEIRNNFV